MSLEGLRPGDITEAVLRNLIAAQVPEGKTIDYKAELPGGSDGAKKDFLADLCSFANAAGGHLVFGMTEADGLPVSLDGLDGDMDQAILRLESMARDGVRPPIPGLEFARVTLASGKGVLIAHLPKSWNPPHQVIFQKDFRFYTRGSAGKQHLDVDELRRIVLQSQEIGERIRQFRAGRVGAVMSESTPVPLLPGARQMLHFVPFAAFGVGTAIDLNAAQADRGQFVAMMNRGGSMRHNVDGLLAYSPSGEVHDGYAQLFRNGIIEIVTVFQEWNPRGKLVLPIQAFEEDVIAQTKAALAVLARTSGTIPVAALLSFTGIHGWFMGIRDPYGNRGYRGGFDRDPLLIPELVLQTLDNADVPRLVRPLIDATWNAAGLPQSDYYDSDGNWIGDKVR